MMHFIDILLQAVILIMNLSVNVLVTMPGSYRRAGFIIGALVQPLWIIENITHNQDILVLFSIINMAIWVSGIIKNKDVKQ